MVTQIFDRKTVGIPGNVTPAVQALRDQAVAAASDAEAARDDAVTATAGAEAARDAALDAQSAAEAAQAAAEAVPISNDTIVSALLSDPASDSNAAGAALVNATIETGLTPEAAQAIANTPELSNTIADTGRTFTQKQVFDATEGFGLGPNLRAFYDEGNAGTRFTITGDGIDANSVMPYLQMQLNTRTGSDAGHAIGGFQIQFAGAGGGAGGNNREYYMVEIIGENHPHGPHARIGMARSGTGQRRPMWYVNGDDNIPALAFERNDNWMGFSWTGWAEADQPWMQAGQVLRFVADNNLATAIEAFRYNGSLKALGAYIYSETSTHSPYVELGKARGTYAAPTPPVASDILGQVRFVSPTPTGVRGGAIIRTIATEAWSYSAAEGTRIEFLTKQNGGTVETVSARVSTPLPSTAGATALTMLVNRDGVQSLVNVMVGAVDSGGIGYRQLVVAN